MMTDFAMNHENKHEHEPKMWDPLVSNLVANLDEANERMKKFGLPSIEKGNASAGQKLLATRQVNGH